MENSKNNLRKYAKEIRKNITYKEIKEDRILKYIISNKYIQMFDNILIYIPLKYEVSTIKLIEELQKLKKNIYAPKIVDKNIEFYKFNSFSDLKMSKYNILEPTCKEMFDKKKKAVIIVPGLLFDKNFNRLGYGGGYYDRYLEGSNLYKIGVCFNDCLVESIISLNHDIKMDEIITERKVWSLKD